MIFVHRRRRVVTQINLTVNAFSFRFKYNKNGIQHELDADRNKMLLFCMLLLPDWTWTVVIEKQKMAGMGLRSAEGMEHGACNRITIVPADSQYVECIDFRVRSIEKKQHQRTSLTTKNGIINGFSRIRSYISFVFCT